MVGIILMSHGRMAEGMLDSCKLFFGDDVPQIKALCLLEENSPEDYDQMIQDAFNEVNTGDGVIGMCDLLGGTPSNRCGLAMRDDFQVITGMNFTMLLELLGKRLCVEKLEEIDINALMETGRNGIQNLNAMFK